MTRTARGRPSRAFVLEQVDLSMEDLRRAGGLPSPDENAEIWRGIWVEETHNSTAIEGNTLLMHQVRELLAEGRAVGDRELREYLEVEAYSQAADWVYGHGIGPESWDSKVLLTKTELRQIHALTIGPVWAAVPPRDLGPHEHAGDFRRREILPFPDGMTPPPWTDVPSLMDDWLDLVNKRTDIDEHPIVHLARVHADFERIHPFHDGNGRLGRLVLNLLLVRRGYAPAIIRKQQRARYLNALSRADGGDIGPLSELLARAMKESLDRFLVPNLAGPVRLLPLSALTRPGLGLRAIRAAASRGRLRASWDASGRWVSSKRWVDEYVASKSRSGRPPSARG